MTQHDTHHQDNLAERVLERIEDEHLTPRSRWVFILQNYLFWILGALALALGALAFSATLFQATIVDWSLSLVTHTSFFDFFIEAAPLLWVSALALFILIGYMNVHRTVHGYRYPVIVVTLGSVLLSVTFGSGLYAVGLGGALDEAIGDHPPLYRPIVAKERSWWLAPEKGLLTGQVVEVASGTDSFVLRDFSGQSWEIDGSGFDDQELSALAAHGEEVRIVGLPTAVSVPAAESAQMMSASATATATTTVFRACAVLSRERDKDKRNASLESHDESCENVRPYRQLRDLEKDKKDKENKEDRKDRKDDNDSDDTDDE